MRDAIDGALPAGRDPESVEAAARQLLEADSMPSGRPSSAAVFEDALAGVEGRHAWNFAWVVCGDRAGS